MGPLFALLVAALATAAPAETDADASEPVASEPVASTPQRDDAPRDPFARVPVRAAAAEPPPAPPAPPPDAKIVRAQLRDPFVGPRLPGTRTLSTDLKDPFALPPGRDAAQKPSHDIRDPFVPRPDGTRPGECLTPGGVPVQRPRSLRIKPCPGLDAPLVNPFSAA